MIAIFGVSILMFNACKKDMKTNPVNSTEGANWTAEDLKIQNTILNFQNKIKNNTYKSGEDLGIDSAIWYMEALMNYNYSTPDSSFVNLTIDTTFEFEIIVNNDMVSYNDITDAAFAMEEHIVNFLNQMPADIKFMIAADVNIKDNDYKDGTRTVTIITAYGSEYIDNPSAYPPFGENDYWWYGFNGGGCESNSATTSDAAEKIQYRINHPQVIIPDPTTTYIVNLTPVPIEAWNYINDDDVAGPSGEITDNWLDYMMYHESDYVNLLQLDGCLEPEEMNFYLQGTLDVIQIELENIQQTNPDDILEFVYLSLNGEMISGGENSATTYLHMGSITFGKRVSRVAPIE